MSSTTDPEPKKPSRVRPIQACIPCHRSKRKCNRRKPCSQCLKRRVTASCVYETLPANELSALENPATSAVRENEILRTRIAELEAVITALRDDEKQHGYARGNRRRHPSMAADNEGVYYGRSFYLGGSAAPSLLQQMISLAPNEPSDLLFAFFGGTDGNDDVLEQPRDIFDHPFPSHYGVPEMLSLLQSSGRPELDAYLDSFFEIVDPLHHYVPTPWVLLRYEKCFDVNSQPPPQELALIFAIAGLGDLVASNKSSWPLIAGSLHLLRVSKFLTSPSIDAVVTFCFIAVYLQHEGRLNEYWPLLGMVIRIAQSMGLHRDPKLIKNLSPEEGEVRRRVFHSIAAQETALSVMFGRPTSLGFFDCELPKDISDNELFGDSTYQAGRTHEISYNRHTFELMVITREMWQASCDSHESDLARAKTISKRLHALNGTFSEPLKYKLSPTLTQTFDSLEDRSRFVQSLVLHIILNHNILVLFRRPLLTTSSVEAAEPCFQAAIAVAEGWKVLQDSFPKMARITWMHWYRAFHAALICLVAIKADSTDSTTRAKAITSWNSCVRIFSRLQPQNESMRCCSRALNRLNSVVKSELKQRRRGSSVRGHRAITDSSMQLRLSSTIGACRDADQTSDFDQLLPSVSEISAQIGQHCGSTTPTSFNFDAEAFASLPDPIDYGQAFESFMSQPHMSHEPTQLLIDNADAQFNIFDMDASNWPAWLLDERSPTGYTGFG